MINRLITEEVSRGAVKPVALHTFHGQTCGLPLKGVRAIEPGPESEQRATHKLLLDLSAIVGIAYADLLNEHSVEWKRVECV